MKRLSFFLTLSFLLASFSAFSQFEKGTLLLGGSASTGIDIDDEATTFFIGLQPQAGMFLSERAVLGTGLNLGFSSGGETTLISYGLSPFGRYYLVTNEPVNWFAGAGLGFSGRSFDGDNSSLFTGNINAGASIFANSSVALEPAISLGFVTPSEGDTYVVFSLNAGFQMFLSPGDRENRSSVTPDVGRGALMIGGSSGGFNIQFRRFDQTVFFFNLFPNVGYLFTDQFMGGLGVDFLYADFGDGFTRTSYGVLPFARYYLAGPIPRQAWFVQGEAGIIGSASQSAVINFSDSDFLSRLGAGTDIFLSPVTAIEGIAGVEMVSGEGSTDLQIFVRLGVQLFWNQAGSGE